MCVQVATHVRMCVQVVAHVRMCVQVLRPCISSMRGMVSGLIGATRVFNDTSWVNTVPEINSTRK